MATFLSAHPATRAILCLLGIAVCRHTHAETETTASLSELSVTGVALHDHWRAINKSPEPVGWHGTAVRNGKHLLAVAVLNPVTSQTVFRGDVAKAMMTALSKFEKEPCHRKPVKWSDYQVDVDEASDYIAVSIGPHRLNREGTLTWSFGSRADSGQCDIKYFVRRSDAAILLREEAE